MTTNNKNLKHMNFSNIKILGSPIIRLHLFLAISGKSNPTFFIYRPCSIQTLQYKLLQIEEESHIPYYKKNSK